MKASALGLVAVLLLAAVFSDGTAAWKSTSGCCTRYSRIKKLPVMIFRGCRVQNITERCNLPAVILLTVNGRRICGNPGSKAVKKIINALRCCKAETPKRRSIGRRQRECSV